MTCIVGYVDDKKVWMGADSHGVCGWDTSNRKDPKVFKRGSFIIGFTSSYRMGQILMVCHLPKPGVSAGFNWMVREFVPAVRAALLAGGMATDKDNETKGGQFLVGMNGQLFNIHSDFQVAVTRDRFDSCGCGDSYALAAMKMMDLSGPLLPAAKIKKALSVAEYFSAGVRGPYKILSL